VASSAAVLSAALEEALEEAWRALSSAVVLASWARRSDVEVEVEDCRDVSFAWRASRERVTVVMSA
jgi:hypothetical protein